MANPADLDDPAVLEAFVDGIVTPLMTNNNSPSGTVSIVKDGQLIFAKGYGFQDIENQIPVDPYRTLFRPGSVSKLFTWVSVMQLVEQGKLDLDADVNDYLDTFKIRDTFERPVTLRDIMTHSPGFEDGGLGYLIIRDPEDSIPLRDAMERFQPMRVNPPGAQTSYTNYGTALAGHIVAKLSGLSFQDYVQQNIFDPLGMRSSSFVEPLPDHLLENMAVSYANEAGNFVEKPFEIVSSFAPAGAMSATSTDMAKFSLAILNGGELNGNRILREETVEQMLTRNFTHDDRMMGMALGFYETEINGFRIVGHGGDTAWFHSDLGIDRENNLAYFVSFGSTGGGAVRGSFPPAFYNQFFPRDEAPPVPPEDFSERAGKYAGSYGFWRSNFSTIEKAAGMGGGITVAATENNTLMVGMGDKSKQYVEIEKNLFRQLDTRISIMPGINPRLIAFQENEQGEITGFVMDGLPFMSLRKLPVYETSGFTMTLVGFSLLVFLGVLLRRFYQRAAIRSLAGADRSAVNAAVWTSAANWLVVAVGAIVITAVSDQLQSGVPFAIKLWLVLPIVATVLGIYMLYRMIMVWKDGALTGFWGRLRYTIVTLCALFMGWFYYFWNILGYQYMV
jgi:CubicO group peptidase (beta-lactamase class C family)